MQNLKYEEKSAEISRIMNLEPDEPWFFIRARDILSQQAVGHYADLLEANLARSEDAQQVRDFVSVIKAWQDANPTSLRAPSSVPKQA